MTTDELKQKFANRKEDEAKNYTQWLEEQLISYHEALQLAGKLALKVDSVITSNTFTLSNRINEMNNALNVYDKKILEMNERKPTS